LVAIINYGLGNLASVKKALNAISVDCIITDDPNEIRNSKVIVLPGVGSFKQGMKNLKKNGLDITLTDEVMNKKKPFLGICLGMQLIFSEGSEPEPCKGLGWIKGKVVKFKSNGMRIPHMGWNELIDVNESIFNSDCQGDYYFIHSYHAIPDDSLIISSKVNYTEKVVASVNQDNIFATQFHPEKSQKVGLALLKNYFAKFS
tara:strand:+ start:5138 stop:5743 length:606 start_codon:yes stop_codon:yes gene_type:complete